MIEISIIIRTYNESKHLDKILQKIKNQTTNFTKEVVLVDSGSTDNTVEIAKSHNCRILEIKKEDFTFGRSLNIGCKAALGKYLVILSGHCIPFDENWLQNLVEPLESKNIGYVYGRQVGDQSSFFSEEMIFLHYFPVKSAVPQTGYFCNNANSAILKNVWEKYYFDESITGLEDLHLAKRMINDGLKLGYVSNAIVYHIHNETWPQIYRRFNREAIALKYICPELQLKKRNFIFFFLSSYISDLIAALKAKKDLKNIFYTALLYRFNQYYGSYMGHREIWNSAKKLRSIYYYSGKKGETIQTTKFPN